MQAVLDPVKQERLIADMIRIAADNGQVMTREQAEAFVERRADTELWTNSRYTVIIERDVEVGPCWPEMIWLSIRRNDRERPGPERWRDFQRIKNELVGPEHEGCELYPAELRVADTADQFHLFVLADARIQFPFGFRHGMKAGPVPGGVAAQTPFELD